jgi:prolyl-tRNA synthetase
MPEGKAVQLPSTHFLGQGFAKAFGVSYEDEDGKKKIPYQTCYGPPISRTLAVLASVHGDRKGLVLPFAIAPVQVVVVPIVYRDQVEVVIEKANELVKTLEAAGLRVSLDDSDKKPGAKFYYWEMKGVPVRAEIGPKDIEAGKVTLVRRDTGEKEAVESGRVTEAVREMGERILDQLRHKASEEFSSRVSEADGLDELGDILSSGGGFVRVPFCSRDLDGEACADTVKEKTEGEVRGTVFGEEETPSDKACIACGKPARHYVMVAKSY